MRKREAWIRFLVSASVVVMLLWGVPGSDVLPEAKDLVLSLLVLLELARQDKDGDGTPPGKSDVPPTA